jgi:hypothetical protein
MFSANITFYKLENKYFREFLELYTKKEISKEATLRKGYFDDIFVETIEKLKSVLTVKKFGFQLMKLLT